MILLKELLCWDLDDVTYVKMNAQLSNKKSSLSPEAMAELRKWLSADYMLYDHFRVKFQESVESFGQKRMSREVERLRVSNEALASSCGFKAVDSAGLPKEFRNWGQGIEGYSMEVAGGQAEKERCRTYVLSEVALLDAVRASQADRAKETLNVQGQTFTGYELKDFGNLDVKRFPGDPQKLKQALEKVIARPLEHAFV